jgi:hypothetical protein
MTPATTRTALRVVLGCAILSVLTLAAVLTIWSISPLSRPVRVSRAHEAAAAWVGSNATALPSGRPGTSTSLTLPEEWRSCSTTGAVTVYTCNSGAVATLFILHVSRRTNMIGIIKIPESDYASLPSDGTGKILDIAGRRFLLIQRIKRCWHKAVVWDD